MSLKAFVMEIHREHKKRGKKLKKKEKDTKAIAQQGVVVDGQKLVLSLELIKSTLSVSSFCARHFTPY